ncbi:MAG: benzoate/H(+) symporter BenE family transporter [Pseudomonadota bacterium]
MFWINGVTAFLFACTGPVAIILTVAQSSGLPDDFVSSWLFGCFAVTGLYTLYFSWLHRQPIAFAWTIPGTVLLLTSLDHLEISDVIGAYMATGVLILLVGLSGLSEKLLKAMPKPIVMAMVAGIFLDFGLNLVGAFEHSALMAACMIVTFLLCSRLSVIARTFPPVLVALVAGLVVVWLQDGFDVRSSLPGLFSLPRIYAPSMSLPAMLELVVPLAITVLVVQNGQGFAVLSHAGHRPPMRSMTTACGSGTLIIGLMGSVPMCVTGPSNAILSSNGEKERQYLGALLYGVLAILFGVFSALMTWLAFSLPVAFVAVLGGLATFKVLQGAFVAAFSGEHSLGALVTLVVTVSDVTIWNIGAPFWGLVFGIAVSRLLESATEKA